MYINGKVTLPVVTPSLKAFVMVEVLMLVVRVLVVFVQVVV